MKKHSKFLATIVVLMMTSFGCQKAEELTLTQNEILPLAIGNYWVYADTIIVSTTAPSSDTVVSHVSFRVVNETYVDHVFEENGKNKLERLHGWEIATNGDNYRNFSLFVRGDKVYANSEFGYLQNGTPRFLTNFHSCDGIYSLIEEDIEFLNTNTVTIAPVIQYPLAAGDTLQTFPVFHSYGTCLPSIQSGDGSTPRTYRASFGPLTNSGSSVMVSTFAGTFDCIDYGSQYWSKGIGMIESHNQTTAEYYVVGGGTVTGTIDWKRSLIEYTLE